MMPSWGAGTRGVGREIVGMRVHHLILAGLLVLASGSGSHAGATQTVQGRIELATFGSPAIPRMTYAATQVNGIAGWVFAVTTPGAAFRLETQDGVTGLEDVDVAFYVTLDDTEPVGAFAESGDEAGRVPAGASWAVVTLAAGAGGSFVYTAV
ncbi:MAG TPA: hypothetical protein VGB64_12905 [Actinomycetota bacterium]